MLRRSNRLQSTSSLQPRGSPLLSQPTPTLMQPSPAVSRTRQAHNMRPQSQPIPFQMDNTPNATADPISTEQNVNAPAIENIVCPLCAVHVQDDGPGLMCEKCSTWFHPACLYISDADYNNMAQSPECWHCDHCKSVLANQINWGSLIGEDTILSAIQTAYHEITSWEKNIFSLPRGKASTDFIKELTRIINLFVCKTRWERLALPLLHVFMPIMLQKPSKKSKAKDDLKFLSSRLLK